VNLELVGDTVLQAKLEKAPKGIGKALVAGMVKVGLGLRAHLAEDHLSGQDLNVRTGTGRHSSFYRVETSGEQDIAVIVGNDLRKATYMRAQDQGATITPKQAGSLTIPIGAVKTAKGVARFSARDVIANPGSFGYVGTFTRAGIIYGTKGKKERAVPLFILAKRVRLRAIGFLARTLQEKRDWAQRVINEAIGTELKP
jgi:hypothetical protein